MTVWNQPVIPNLPGLGTPPHIYDSSRGQLVAPKVTDTAGLYVCGITPYDATHLGHAFTYLTFDTLLRAWIDAGYSHQYVQNVTDIDDPLLERANQTHVDWRELADSQIELFHTDMAALGVIPPTEYVAVTDEVALIADMVSTLVARGFAYQVPIEESDLSDIYFDTRAVDAQTSWSLGQVSGLELDDMIRLSRERGGDPDRPGKRDPLDPCLWRAARDGEPSWPSAMGDGRPGWHIECSEIAVRTLGESFAVQGGGLDLLFPHHEFSAAHATAVTEAPLAQAYMHSGLVGYQGNKMSKSRGNLVFVSRLLASGVEPDAIRLALLSHHYRSSWEWHDEMPAVATATLHRWRSQLTDQPADRDVTDASQLLARLRMLMADDLNTPQMIHEIDTALSSGVDNPDLVKDAVLALLGLSL